MLTVLRYVAEHGGCKKIDAASTDGISSLRHGYAAIDRCIAAGLIMSWKIGGHYELNLTDSGRETLALAGKLEAK